MWRVLLVLEVWAMQADFASISCSSWFDRRSGLRRKRAGLTPPRCGSRRADQAVTPLQERGQRPAQLSPWMTDAVSCP